NAIVVLENTHRHQTLGKSAVRSALDGAGEVTLPVLVATACTIIVLCPIALMPGMGGFLFRPLTLALAFAMIASFLLSQTLVPGLCSRWLGSHHGDEGEGRRGLLARIHGGMNAFLTALTRRYTAILEWALGHRRLVLTLVALAFVGSLGFLTGIGLEFFPAVDAGQITMQVRSPSGTNLAASESRIADVEKFLQENIPARERKMIISELGLVPDWSAAYTLNSGTQDTVIKIQLSDVRTRSAQQYASLLRKKFAED